MANARVKDFVGQMLGEIDQLEKQSIAKVLTDMEATTKDSANSGVGGSAVKRDPHVLVRYESECAIQTLRKLLEVHANVESPVSDVTLQPFIDFLQERFKLIKDTNCIYNHSPKSLINQSCIILAKKLFETIDAMTRAAGREIKYLHYYDFLFPGLPCSKYKLQQGHLGSYQLHEFFWSEDVYEKGVLKTPSRPVPTLDCLEAYRNVRPQRPPHIFLTQEEAKSGVVPKLTRSDAERLASHSSCANDYFQAINSKNKKPEAELDKYKIALMELVLRPDFQPGCTYENSNATLIANGFLTANEIFTLRDFASKLDTLVYDEDWRAFVEAIPENELYKILLPKLPSNDPDVSVIDADKFEAFVNTEAWYVPTESRHNNGVLLLLAELYRRNREHEGHFTGTISSLTSGLVGGHSRQKKQDAVDVLMDFFVNKVYPLNQIDEYLIQTKKFKTHAKAIKSDRLLVLVNKANSLWNKLLAETKVPEIPSEEGAVEGFPVPTLVYNAENLANDARRLISPQAQAWSEEVKEINKNALKGYIKSCGDFYSCVTNPVHYIKGNEAYNRAVLYIFTDFYIDNRSTGDDYKSGLGKFFGAPDKVQKIKAGKVLLDFLSSRTPLNQLHEYLAAKGLLVWEGIIKDYSYSSELKTLAYTADAVCTNVFYEPQVNTGIAASVWKMWGGK